MSTNNSPRIVEPIKETGPIGWGAIDSERSGEEAQAVEVGGVFETLAERELQAAHSKNPRREAKKKRVENKRQDVELRQRLAEERRRSSSKKWKTTKSQDPKTLTGLVCDIICTGQKAVDMHIRDKGHWTRERQAELASVNEQLASHYDSLPAAPSDSDSTLYSRGDRAQNQGD